MAEKVAVERVVVEPAVVLRLTGEVDHEGAAQTLRGAVDMMPPPGLLVMDLRELAVLADDGVRTVLAFAAHCAQRGIRCRLLVGTGSAAAQVWETADGASPPRFTDLGEALTADDPPARDVAVPGARTGEAPPEVDGWSSQFEELTRRLLDTTTVGAALQQIIDAATIVVPGADLVSVTLRSPDGRFYTPVQTDPVATELDQVQYHARQGPCVDAARPDGPGYVVSDDLGVEQRWREFSTAAAGHGFAAIIATELASVAGPDRLSGALNLYSRRTGGLSVTDRHAALLLATHATLALAHVHGTELADVHQAHLLAAIDSRDVIGQAKGILMHRQGIGADEAFDLLSRTSQELNVKLVDLARTLTDRHSELDPP